ncbi:MAG: hypothetical protein GQ525_09580 [Draconibacterium sp.]|nr:hypothetical protein [Draconibacterium sp.]
MIKSDTSELNEVELFVNELFEEYGIPIKYFNSVYLCISEAVVNSIKHGNKNDISKQVFITANFVEKVLKIKIKDEGEGFILKDVKSPIDNSNIKNETGRGIHIIKTLSHSIKYNKKGNSIHFKIDCK